MSGKRNNTNIYYLVNIIHDQNTLNKIFVYSNGLNFKFIIICFCLKIYILQYYTFILENSYLFS